MSELDNPQSDKATIRVAREEEGKMPKTAKAPVSITAALVLLTGCDDQIQADSIEVQRAQLIVSVADQDQQESTALNKLAIAVCPEGYTVVGGGYQVTYDEFRIPADSILVTGNAPTRAGIEEGPPNAWRVGAFQPADGGIPWALTAYAQCYRWRPTGVAQVPDIEFPSGEIAVPER